MKPKLIAIAGPLRGSAVELTSEMVSLGRDAANVIPLNDLSASRCHCLLQKEGGRYKLIDADSHNGTFVNNLPVKERLLDDHDLIKVGSSTFVFLYEDAEALSPSCEVNMLEEGLITHSSIKLRAEDVLDLRTRELNALVKISSAVTSTQSPEALSRELLRRTFEAVPAERGAILLIGEGTEEFSHVYGLRREEGQADPIAVSQTVVREVLRDGVALLSNDALDSERFGSAQSIVAAQVSSLVCVPVSLFGKVIGVIYLDTHDRTTRFGVEHLQLVTAVANIAAGTLENTKYMQWLERENERLRSDLEIEHNIIGESPRMRQVLDFIARVAPVDTTVLINGESGTGKELVAHAIHRNSSRAARPFVVVNCAAIAENLLESEFFGHERGAFTGAVAQKKGKFEAADGGTLFLDEVGELPPPLQAKLLRALQAQEFERVGGTRTVKVNIRVVAATNRDLELAIKQGAFRHDLYYRLNVVSLVMPPLRERRVDIHLLANYFAAKYGEKCKRMVAGISPEARACLIKYDWPGNVRELENAIEHAIVLGAAERIMPEDLPEAVTDGSALEQGVQPMSYYDQIREAKKQFILKALEMTNGDYAEAARRLRIHPNNLYRLVRNLNLKAALKR